MAQDSISLQLVGFSEFEEENIASILSLAERGLLKKWRIVAGPPADFFLLPESLNSRMDQEESLRSLPRDRCIFSSKEDSNLNDASGDMWLSCDSRNVPRIRSLIDLFNLICEDTLIDQKNQGPVIRTGTVFPSKDTVSSDEAASVAGEAFIPRQGFIGRILGASEQSGLLIYELNDPDSPGRILVYPEQQVFYSPASLDLLAPFFSADERSISCKTMSDVTDEAIEQLAESEDLKPYTLRSLLWYGVFKSSQGRLLEGESVAKPVRLKRWPDLNLADCQELVKLAAYMQSNAASLETIAGKTAIPINLVIDFYNACEVVGLIEHSPEADIHDKRLNSEKVSLFAKIRSRLNKSL
ncbi:MAG: hypothetical protein ACU841_16685 [Gammaproteobacteria bacterium]